MAKSQTAQYNPYVVAAIIVQNSQHWDISAEIQ